MDFAIPDELVALRRSFAAFVDREVRPRDEAVRESIHAGAFEGPVREAAMEVKRRSCEEGFFAAHLPEHVGGWGLSTLGMTLLVEDAARSGLRLAAYAVGPPNPEAPTPLLLDLPEHLWETYLTPLVRGEQSMCFALTEPEAGSDAQAITTRAEPIGPGGAGGWVLNGRKHYITNADRADFAVVFAVTDAEKRAAGGITAFVVPRSQWSPGKKQLTIADTHPSELVLDDARVPADHVVGEVGMGFFAAMKFLNAGRAFIGAQCLGLAEWCLDVAVEHAKSRTAFGKPIGKFQGVSFPLAECKAEIEAMRWLTYHLAWAVDQGDQPMLDASIVKYYDTERAYAVADRCLQVFGGMGLLKEGPIEHVLRHLRMLRVVEGATEVQKLVIARSLGL
ncbi:MAG TPA: acyl-CoA dehydrogenase family protein [Frankiaceae bacterium]|jgi:acyl-CoA dehydrogenase|nr:acyl-CoA dehydrogenase family protein [Frankiaceae bacterium]